MIWVIRAGRHSAYYEKYIQNSKVYIPWEGYHIDLSTFDTRQEFKEVVKKEKGVDNRTSIANWYGQLYMFVKEMREGDLVLIPSRATKSYCLAEIVGAYKYSKNEKDKLYHSRDIRIIDQSIPKSVFAQEINYSLGAFRTIFRARYEEEILQSVNNWRAVNENSI